MYFELHMIYRNSSVRIYGSIHSKTEDIFNRLEGGPDLEFSEERPFLLQRSLKTKIGDFLSGRVNLAVVTNESIIEKTHSSENLP